MQWSGLHILLSSLLIVILIQKVDGQAPAVHATPKGKSVLNK